MWEFILAKEPYPESPEVQIVQLVVIIIAIALVYFGMKTNAFLFYLLSSFFLLYLAIIYSSSVFLLITFIGTSLGVAIFGLFGGKQS